MARKFSPIVGLALLFAIFYEPDNFDPESIRGKRVLITGSSSGIGEELAYHYSELGASIMLTARREDNLKTVAKKCLELGAKSVNYVVADMSKPEHRQRLVNETDKQFKGGLDHLVLNHGAGNVAPWTGTEQNMTSLRRDLEVNFISHVDIASKSLPMLTANNGNIGVVSSLAGIIGFPLFASYGTDKFALHGFFTALRQELRNTEKDVSVTLFVLGYIDSKTGNDDMNKLEIPNYFTEPASVNETATVIIKGITKRAYEVQYPKSTRFTIFLHKIAPGYLENYYGSLIAKSPLYNF